MTKLKYDPKNAMKHPDANKAMLGNSFDECGAGRSVLVDKDDVLIAGNAAYEQAEARGIPIRIIETDGTELVAVKRTDLATDDPKRTRLALYDNRTSELAEWDFDVLEGMDSDLLEGMDFEFEQAPEFTEYDESIADDVSVCICPTCGHEHSKKS